MTEQLKKEKLPEDIILDNSYDTEMSVIEYVETEMATLHQKPFTVVDSVVLSQLSYLNAGSVIPGIGDKKPVTVAQLYRAEHFDEYVEDTAFPKQNRQLLNAVCASPRFRDIQINYYIDSVDEEKEKQFCAMTFFLPTGEMYVAYRGTDTTINGWKEDFNMFFMDVIPGQISAARYLKWVAARTKGRIYVGGHSKGGNLAMYSASFVSKEIQDRIITVFNHDGPGLTKGAMAKPEFSDITAKMNITLPHSSVIGLIFSHGNYSVVQSKRLGLLQHDLFSWEISDGDFIYEEKVKPGGNKVVDSVYDLMEVLSEEDRQLFVDTVFDIIESAGATSFNEFPAMAVRSRDKIMQAMKDIDPATAEIMKNVIGEFISISARKTFSMPENEITAKISSAVNKIGETRDRIGEKIAEQTIKSIEATEKLGARLNEKVAKVTETTERLSGRITEGVTRLGETGTALSDIIAGTVQRAKDRILPPEE
ncbi:MAG: DUF2974 domain-containing protein [Oscillospiraceae bacterium]|nr:DUF2974 domain-containing protein [Oscillospiraceae bacterium]